MPTLSIAGCTVRRKRLLEVLQRFSLDAAVISDVRDIYYFTGILLPADLPAALQVDASERLVLVGPKGHDPDLGALHDWADYSWNQRGTRDPDVATQMAETLRQATPSQRHRTAGIQGNALLYGIAEALGANGFSKFVCIDAPVREMQRRKDADEVETIRASIRANLGAYEAVRSAIRPGASELDVLAAGYRGAMETAGEKVLHDGDYQCGQYNGPARSRRIEAGELYIVDAWTCYRGYWSDMSRTFYVGSGPSGAQLALFEHIRWVQLETRKLLKPGVDGRDVFRALDEMIRQHPPLAAEGLIHHGGHAIGLRSHEMPDVNLGRGGVLEPGNVICIEPGGYFSEARYGVRLENMYLITIDGCEDLCPEEVVLHECG